MLIYFKEQINQFVFTPLESRMQEINIPNPSTVQKCKLVGIVILGAALGSVIGACVGKALCASFTATVVGLSIGGVIGGIFAAIFYRRNYSKNLIENEPGIELQTFEKKIAGIDHDSPVFGPGIKNENKNSNNIEEPDDNLDYKKEEPIDNLNDKSELINIKTILNGTQNEKDPFKIEPLKVDIDFDEFFEILNEGSPPSSPNFHFTIDSSIINTSFEIIQDEAISNPLKKYLSCPNIKKPKPNDEVLGPQQWSMDVARINYYLNKKLLSKDVQEVNQLIKNNFGEQGFLNIASIAHQGFTPELITYIQHHPQDGKNFVLAKGVKAECYIEEYPFSINIIIHFELLDDDLNNCGYRSGSRFITMSKEDLSTNWVGKSSQESLLVPSLKYFDTYSDTFSTQVEAENDINRKKSKQPKFFVE